MTRKEQAQLKCREALDRIKEETPEKNLKRARFKKWFLSKGFRNRKEFGNWVEYFGGNDDRCKDWDLLIHHWGQEHDLQEVRK